MNKIIRLRLLAVAIGAAAIIAAAAGFSRNTPQAEASDALPVSQTKYLVREHMGMVAVFSPDNEMIRLTDYPVSVLPRADRESLSRGVAVDSDTELALLLEDYQS